MVTLALGLIPGHGSHGGGSFAIILIFGSILAMFVCSIICAVQIGNSRGIGFGILAFIVIQVFYISVSAVGCTATL